MNPRPVRVPRRWEPRWWDPLPSFVQRQVLLSVVFAAAVGSIPFTGLSVATGAALLAACGLLAVTTAVAVGLPWRRWSPAWRTAVPLAAMVAVGLLQAATGGVASPFAVLLFLPAMALGAEVRHRRDLGWVPLAAALVVAMPVLLGLDGVPMSTALGLRLLTTPLIVAITAWAMHELTREVRRRIGGMRELQLQQERLLQQLRRDADELAERSRALQGARDAFSSVIDAVTEQAIIATDTSGQVRVFNPGAERLLGFDRPQVLRRLGITDLLVDGPGLAQLVAGAAEGGSDVREVTLRTSAGAAVHARLSTTARRDPDGALLGYLFVAADIAPEQHAARLKDQFVSLVSHELRTPLSSIMGYLELVLDDDEVVLAPQHAEYLSVVQRNAVRLLDLVGDLLFTAQVEAGQLQVAEQQVDLTAVVAASVQTAGPTSVRGGVAVRTELPDGPVVVRGDPLRLGQACDNLLSNAVKFTPAGGEVVVRLAGEGSDGVLLEVTDTGYGIADDELERLFTPFFRAGTASRHSVAGIGLGLSITRAIVLAHHGSMDVSSVEGAGTTFCLRLPGRPATASGALADPARVTSG